MAENRSRALIVRMICEFLDYYSSRFDLNRCLFSASFGRSNSSQRQQQRLHEHCIRNLDAPKYFIIFFKSILGCSLVDFFSICLSYALKKRLRIEKEREAEIVVCENKTHTRNYIVRQKKTKKCDWQFRTQSNRIELQDEEEEEGKKRSEYGSTTQQPK